MRLLELRVVITIALMDTLKFMLMVEVTAVPSLTRIFP